MYSPSLGQVYFERFQLNYMVVMLFVISFISFLYSFCLSFSCFALLPWDYILEQVLYFQETQIFSPTGK